MVCFHKFLPCNRSTLLGTPALSAGTAVAIPHAHPYGETDGASLSKGGREMEQRERVERSKGCSFEEEGREGPGRTRIHPPGKML